MKELKVLQQQQILGKPLTLYGDFENPLFLAKEVAEWIEHSNPRMMLQAVDDDEKGVNIAYTPGGNQEVWFLTEYGVYEVLMQSRKPIAKQFKKEVKTVLKSIRKYGVYMTSETLEQVILNPDTVIQLVETLKKEKEEMNKRKEKGTRSTWPSFMLRMFRAGRRSMGLAPSDCPKHCEGDRPLQ